MRGSLLGCYNIDVLRAGLTPIIGRSDDVEHEIFPDSRSADQTQVKCEIESFSEPSSTLWSPCMHYIMCLSLSGLRYAYVDIVPTVTRCQSHSSRALFDF